MLMENFIIDKHIYIYMTEIGQFILQSKNKKMIPQKKSFIDLQKRLVVTY